MARTKGMNKSEAIREYLKANPKAKAKDVVEALKGKGVNVTANLVYFLKGKSSAKKLRKRKVIRAARAATRNGAGHGDAIALIQDVRALAQRAGGYEQLKSLVDAIAG